MVRTIVIRKGFQMKIRVVAKKSGWPERLSDESSKSDDGFVEISFRAKSDCVENFLRLLQYCDFVGGVGHSFEIEVDPDDERGILCGFDGDGSDQVKDIKLNGRAVTREFIGRDA